MSKIAKDEKPATEQIETVEIAEVAEVASPNPVATALKISVQAMLRADTSAHRQGAADNLCAEIDRLFPA